jgi:hypothetical protein
MQVRRWRYSVLFGGGQVGSGREVVRPGRQPLRWDPGLPPRPRAGECGLSSTAGQLLPWSAALGAAGADGQATPLHAGVTR